MGAMNHKAAIGMGLVACLDVGKSLEMGSVVCRNRYEVECFDKDGNLKWREDVWNLVVNTGLNDILNKYYKGSSYTAAFYVGLKGQGNVQAGDTMAGTLDGSPVNDWLEITPYSNGSPTDRPALTLGTVASQSVDNSASKASFSIDQSATVYGAFLATQPNGVNGTLIGAADFSSSWAVQNGDTLNVTVTLTMAAA